MAPPDANGNGFCPGLAYQQLFIFSTRPEMQRLVNQGAKFRDVVNHVILRETSKLCNGEGRAFAEIIPGGAAPATHYVAHASDSRFQDVLRALARHDTARQKGAAGERHRGNDIRSKGLCVGIRGTGEREGETERVRLLAPLLPMRPPDEPCGEPVHWRPRYWLYAFCANLHQPSFSFAECQKAMRACGGFMLAADANLLAANRLWCFLEISYAASEGIPIDAEIGGLDVTPVADQINNADVRRCMFSGPGDQKDLVDQISDLGGPDYVNDLFRSTLHKALHCTINRGLCLAVEHGDQIGVAELLQARADPARNDTYIFKGPALELAKQHENHHVEAMLRDGFNKMKKHRDGM